MKRKLLAALMTVSMLLTLLPMSLWALADDTGADAGGSTAVGTDTGGGAEGSTAAGSDTGDREGDGGGGSGSGKRNPVPLTTTTTVEQAWITRLDLPQYASDFYTALVKASDNDQPGDDILTTDSNYRINTSLPDIKRTSVESVQVVEYAEPSFLADDLPADGAVLGSETSYTLDPTKSDEAIDYTKLTRGNLVRTSSFNGIYVASVPRSDNPNFDADLMTAKDNILAAVRAFDRDHPEVFWLTGRSKLRIGVANVPRNGKTVQEAFFFYVVADNEGFSIRDAAYAANGAIQSGIIRRDAAVKAILATVPKSGAQAQAKALNKWLTEHNEYNTSADLNAIGNAPHRCLSALTGSAGVNGPVCEGYSKAFKVLCDQLRLPCVLEQGYARATPSGGMGLHMWNLVKMPDGQWYGADITWDDPVVAGKTGALSGRENENYLLLGSGSVVGNMRFDASHQPDGTAGGPYLSAAAFSGGEVLPVVPAVQPAPDQPFQDVPAGAYYVDAVKWALAGGVTDGTSATTFTPDATCTRGQVVTFLWRAKGEPAPRDPSNPFADVKAGAYYHTAVLWAVEQGITAGTADNAFSPEMTCSRSQIVTFLWRCMGKPGDKGSAVWYADAVNWADGNGLLAGTAQAFTPEAPCPRADVVTYLYRALT